MRARGCKYRPARKKLYLVEKDAKARVKVLKQWVKKPKGFWVKKIHGWMDNKKWVRPLTPQQRAKYNATNVSGHLRFSSEGQDQGFTRPRVDHALLGIPSINICAMLAKDRVILWHDCGDKWNGEVASKVYKGPVIKALRRTWGVPQRPGLRQRPARRQCFLKVPGNLGRRTAY